MIRRFLDCSSGHLSPETWNWLDAALSDEVLRDRRSAAVAQVSGGRTRCGWFVFVPEDGEDGDVPEDLARVLAYARASDAAYVLFDVDALPDLDLPMLHPDFAPGPADDSLPAPPQ